MIIFYRKELFLQMSHGYKKMCSPCQQSQMQNGNADTVVNVLYKKYYLKETRLVSIDYIFIVYTKWSKDCRTLKCIQKFIKTDVYKKQEDNRFIPNRTFCFPPK